MPFRYLIITIFLMVISIPLSLFLKIKFNISNAFLIFTVMLGPVVIGVGFIIRFMNSHIGLSYLEIPNLVGGQLSASRIFLKPKYRFELMNHKCELTYTDGNYHHRVFTTLKAEIQNNSYLRLYPNKWELIGLKRLFPWVKYIQVGDDEFDNLFVVESKNTALPKMLFSGNAIGYIKKHKKKISEIKIEIGHFFFSMGGVWLNNDEYRDLVDLAIVCLKNVSLFNEQQP